VEKVPEDPDARRAWLERWAHQKEAQLDRLAPQRIPMRHRIGSLVERQVERLDPVFDRKLRTADSTPFANGFYVSGPSPWHILPRALRRVGASPQDVFVDFGCGTGRVVHQAAKRPLKKVIGVEVIAPVAQRAETLVAAHRHRYRCDTVEIVNCDVRRFPIPHDLTIAYLGQVQGFSEEVLGTLLRNLIVSIDRRPRRVRLIYHQPRYRGGTLPATPMVHATERFRLRPDLSFGATAIFESCGSTPSV
jgi:SAM-dependent methyltransferase